MRTAASLTLLLALTAPAMAADTSARMQVSAQVLARAVVSVDAQPSEVVVTETDLARGYVELAEPLQIRVRSNSRNGYLLQVASYSDAFSAVQLHFGNTSMNVLSGESWVARESVAGTEVVRMSVRVELAPGTAAGRHTLPLAFSASAL